jgi:hypothetical protein
LKRALQPAIKNVTVDWGQPRVIPTGATLAPSPPGGPIVVEEDDDEVQSAVMSDSKTSDGKTSSPPSTTTSDSKKDKRVRVVNVNVKQSPQRLPYIFPGTRYFGKHNPCVV